MKNKTKNRGKKESLASLRDIAKYSNVTYQTLNYYTVLGLINSHKRDGNKRLYSFEGVKKRLKKINKLKNLGYPLQIICTIINGSKRR